MQEDPICYNLNCKHTLSNHGHTINKVRCECHKFIDEETNRKARQEAIEARRNETKEQRLQRLAMECMPLFSAEELEKLK
jgi:hypothetical protein